MNILCRSSMIVALAAAIAGVAHSEESSKSNDWASQAWSLVSSPRETSTLEIQPPIVVEPEALLEAKVKAASAHEQLDAALWVQTSGEFQAIALQTFTSATEKLDLALRDPLWTASIEQHERGRYENLPPAVIVNLDETVWNNGPYQARIILLLGQHSMDNFIAWCHEAKCTAVPGAKHFLKHAKEAGVTIVYITPRPDVTRDGTLRNLERLGYPYDANKDLLLMSGGWPDHDKREEIAQKYRILLIVSDHLGDFMHGTEADTAVRREMAARYADHWGLRWFILPNPMYGHWEYSLHDYDYSLDRPQRNRNKLKVLDPELTDSSDRDDN